MSDSLYDILLENAISNGGASAAKLAAQNAKAQHKYQQQYGAQDTADSLDYYGIASNNSGLESASEMERDARTMSPIDLENKYGGDVGEAINTDRLVGRKNAYLDSTIEADWETRAADLINNTGGAAISGLASIAHLGGMGVNTLTGLPVDEATGALLNAINDQVDAHKSPHQLAKEREYQSDKNRRMRDVESRDYDSAFDKFMAEIGATGGALLSNPEQILSTTESGIGSLISGSVGGSILQAGAKGIAKNQAKKAVIKEQAKKEVKEKAEDIGKAVTELPKAKTALEESKLLTHVKEVAPFVAANVAEEAGGIGNDTFDRVMAYSHEELMRGSKEYRDRLELGESPEEAKKNVARKARNVAYASAIPGLLASNFMVGKLEAAPFARVATKTIPGTMAKEGMSEFIDEGLGTLTSNMGVKAYADTRQDIMEDVASSATEGAFAGVGMAGAAKAPSFAINTLPKAVTKSAGLLAKTTGVGLGLAGKAIDGAVDIAESKQHKRNAKADAEAIGSNESLKTKAEALDTAAAESIKSIENDSSLSKKEKAIKTNEVNDHVSAVKQLLNPTVNTQYFGALSDEFIERHKIEEREETSRNVVEHVNELYSMMKDKNTSEEDADALLNLIVRHTQDIQSSIAVTQADPATAEATQAYLTETMNMLEQYPSTRHVIDQIMTIYSNKEVPADIETKAPDANTLNHMVNKAILAPESLTAAQSAAIMNHAKKAKNLPKGKFKTLERANNMIQQAEATIAGLEAQGALTPKALITKSIMTMEDISNNGKMSAKSHFQRIAKAYDMGDIEAAKAYMEDLGGFAQHMLNKTEAFQKSLKDGERHTHQARNPEGGWYESTKAYGVTKFGPKAKNSMKMAKTVEAEANFLADMYNSMAQDMPELYAKPLTKVTLDGKSAIKDDSVATVEVNEDIDEQMTQKKIEELEAKHEKKKAKKTEAKKEEKTPDTDNKAVEEATPETAKEPKAKEEIAETAIPIDTHEDQSSIDDLNNLTAEFEQELEGFEFSVDEFDFTDDNLFHVKTNTKSESSKEHTPLSNEEFEALSIKDGAKFKLKEPEIIDGVKYYYKAEESNDVVGLDRTDGVPYVNMARIADPKAVESFADRFMQDGLDSVGLKPDQFIELFKRNDGTFDALSAGTFLYRFLGNKINAIQAGVYPRHADNKINKKDPAYEMLEAQNVVKAFTPHTARKYEMLSRDAKLIASKYDSLANSDAPLDAKNSNGLHKAFDLTLRSPSVAKFVSNPIQYFTSTIGSYKDKLLSKFGKNVRWYRSVTTDYKSFVNNYGNAIIGKLNDALNVKGAPLLAKLAQGSNRFGDGQVLNLVKQNSKGEYVFDTQLVSSAVLGGLQTMIQNNSDYVNMDPSRLAEILGVPEYALTDDLLAIMNDGMIAQDIKSSMAHNIKQYWGFKIADHAPVGLIDGIAEALAAEIVTAMQDITFAETGTPLINKETVDIKYLDKDGTEKVKTINKYVPVDMTDFNNIQKFKTLISETMLTKPEQVWYIGKDKPKIDEFSAKEGSELTKENKEAIEILNNVEYRPNTAMIDLVDKMGLTFLNDLVYPETRGDLDTFNKRVKSSSESKRNLATKSFNDLKAALEYAANNVEIEGEPVFRFRHFISAERRIHQAHPGPQTNKLLRELLTATREVLDLSDANSDVSHSYRAALAQAWGIPVNKLSRATVDARFNEFAESVKDNIAVIQQYQADPESVDLETLQDAFSGAIRNSGMDNTVVAIHALLDYAKFEGLADKSKHETNLYIEVDGTTSGSAMAALLYGSQLDNAMFIKLLERSGFGITDTESTFNDKSEHGNMPDNYKELASVINQNGILEIQGHDPNNADHMHSHTRVVTAFSKFASTFGMDITSNAEGAIQVGRNFVKSLLTVLIYGSSPRGVADSYVSDMFKQVEQLINEAAQIQNIRDYKKHFSYGQMFFPDIADANEANQKIDDIFTTLNTMISADFDERVGIYTGQNRKVAKDKLFPVGEGLIMATDWRKFNVNTKGIKNIAEVATKVFAEPAYEVAKQVITHDVMESMKLVGRSTNNISIIATHLQDALVQQKLKEKANDPSWNKADYLTREEIKGIKQIVRNLLKVPKMGGMHNPTIVKQGRNTSEKPLFGHGMKQELATTNDLMTSKNLGVAGIPFNTIQHGDSAQIHNVTRFYGKDFVGTNVHDGINILISKAMQFSKDLNKLTLDDMLNKNIMKEIGEFHLSIIDNIDSIIDTMGPEAANAMLADMFAMDIKFGKGNIEDGSINVQTLKDRLQAQNNEIYNKALNVEISHRMMKETNMTSQNYNGLSEGGHTQEGLVYGSPEYNARKAEITKEVTEEFSKTYGKRVVKPNVKLTGKPINVGWNSGNKDHRNLNNMADRPFTYTHNGQTHKFLSIEHAIQTLRSGEFDQDIDRKFKAHNAVKGTVNGKTFFDTNKANTSNYQDLLLDIMREAYKQDKEGTKALLATGNAPLVAVSNNKFSQRVNSYNLNLLRAELRLEFPELASKAKKEASIKPVKTTVIDKENLIRDLVKSGITKGSNSINAKIINAVTRNPKIADVTIKVGDMATMHEEMGYSYDVPEGSTVLGRFFPAENIILVSNEASMESVAHELIHAGTYDILRGFFSVNPETGKMKGIKGIKGPKDKVSAVSKAIMDNFNMMKEFYSNTRQMIDEGRDNDLSLGERDLYDDVSARLERKDYAGALAEFMAWSMTNQDLINLNSKKDANTTGKFWLDASMRVKTLVKSVLSFLGLTGPEFSNLHERLSFNTTFIHESGIEGDLQASPLNHAVSTNPTETKLKRDMQNMLTSKTGDAKFDAIVDAVRDRKNQVAKKQKASDLFEIIDSSNLDLDTDQMTNYVAITSILGAEQYLEPKSMLYAQRLFSHVVDNIVVEDFMDNPNSTDPNDLIKAQSLHDAIFMGKDAKSPITGVSLMLPSFIALATVSPDFAKGLAKLDIPGKLKAPEGNIDSWLNTMGNNSMERLMRTSAGVKRHSSTVDKALADALTSFNDALNRKNSILEDTSYNLARGKDWANDKVVKAIDKAGEAVKKSGSSLKNSQSKAVQKIGSFLQVAGDLIGDKDGKVTKASLEKFSNNESLPHALREFITDLVGLSDSNRPVYKLVKRVKSHVQRVRQNAREGIPSALAGKFKEKLSKEQWSTLTRVVGKTDISALLSEHTYPSLRRLLSSPARIQKEILRLENEVASINPAKWNKVQNKAKQLANYLVTGEVGPNLLVNADQIGRLQGETAHPQRPYNVKELSLLDSLISLYALQNSKDTDIKELRSLLANESEGMESLIKYDRALKSAENSKGDDARTGKTNRRKGWSPFIKDPRKNMIVIPDAMASHYRALGYVRVGDYATSKYDTDKTKKGYYYLDTYSSAPFHQGIMQNVRSTVGGVDALTGASLNPHGGLIMDKAEVSRITAMMRNNQAEFAKEGLIPLYYHENSTTPYAYERTISAEMQEKLKPNHNFAELLGAWKGRQVEEDIALASNLVLVEKLYEMYDQDRMKDDHYVDVLDPNGEFDPVIQDAISLIPKHVIEYANEHYEGRLMVRKDMINDTLGYRMAVIGDMWTGNTRFSKEFQATVREVITAVLGDKAYRWTMKSQFFIQDLVRDARTMIVVKSVVVPAINIVSNIIQLVARGVPLSTIVKDSRRVMNEINYYDEMSKQLMKTEVDIELNSHNPSKRKELEAKKQSIEESFTRLSIYPLLEAGEFSSISSATIDSSLGDLEIGQVDSYLESLVDKLPEGAIRTAGKYAIVSSDTALYRFLQKATDYGDFVAKATLYNDRVNRLGMKKEDALDMITDEYINYDKLQGRSRHTIENLGMAWFWNWKIRATKIGIATLRNNPFHALLASTIPMPDVFSSVGLPFEDSVLGRIFGTGSLTASLGPGMGFNAPFKNPWYSLLFD